MKKLYFIFLGLLLFIASACSKQAESANAGSNNKDVPSKESVTELTVSAPGFIAESNTKTSLIIVPGGLDFSWNSNDKLGFWPAVADVKFPEQAMFFVNPTAQQSKYAAFQANGWGLLRNKLYYSYYPYDEDAEYDKVTIDYTKQTQLYNNNTDHLGQCDYLHSYVTVPEVGGTHLEYSHMNSVAQFVLALPEGAENNSFTEFILENSSNVLVQSASFNPCNTTPAFGTPSTVQSITYSLGFGNGINPENGKLQLYEMMYPIQWGGKEITVKLHDKLGNEYEGRFTGRNQQSGHAYAYASVNGDGSINPIQMEWTCRQPVDLSNPESANCYIVSTSGPYKFKAVKGNSTESIGSVNSAEIYWETVNTTAAPGKNSIIKEVNVVDNGSYIQFSTADSFIKGNALIVAKDNNGVILWSWHIWCTDKPADEEYKNSAGILMDRNLGALSRTGNLSAGFFYQYGRKDPFPVAASLSNTDKIGLVGTSLSFEAYSPSPASSSKCMIYAKNNPAKFLKKVNDLDWVNGEAQNGLWYKADGTKTKFDPCPPGYRVPNGNVDNESSFTNGFYAKAFGIDNHRMDGNGKYKITTAVGTVTFTRDGDNPGVYVPLLNGSTAYYPTAGFLDEDGNFTNWHHHVIHWTNYFKGYSGESWSPRYAGCLNINGTDNADIWQVDWHSGRAAGKSVRCMKIQSNVTAGSTTDNEGYGGTPVPSNW